MTAFDVDVEVIREGRLPTSRRERFRVLVPGQDPRSLAAGEALRSAQRSEPWSDVRVVSVRPAHGGRVQ